MQRQHQWWMGAVCCWYVNLQRQIAGIGAKVGDRCKRPRNRRDRASAAVGGAAVGDATVEWSTIVAVVVAVEQLFGRAAAGHTKDDPSEQAQVQRRLHRTAFACAL